MNAGRTTSDSIFSMKKPRVKKQVRLNKDASEGRGKARIAEIDKVDMIVGCMLQIVFRFIAGYVQPFTLKFCS